LTETTGPIVFSKARLETLVDGIFAVAMTLLVIELKVPEHTAYADLVGAVVRLIPKFIAWIISFFVLGRFWYAHHRLFHHLRIVDGPLVRMNLAYLALVSLMPFCSALTGEFAPVLFAQIVYSVVIALLSALGLLIARHAFHHPELWQHAITQPFYHASRFRTVGLMGVAAMAALIATVVPGAGNMAFMLMWPIGSRSARIERGPLPPTAGATT
jgi:uncharacterized membrane protein